MKTLLASVGIFLVLPGSVLAVTEASILHTTASQEFCDTFTENVWQEKDVYEGFGTDTTTWTFLRDGTFTFAFASDYFHNASGKWFIKRAWSPEKAEVFLLFTDDESPFASNRPSLYTATFSGGQLLLHSPVSGGNTLAAQKKIENFAATCTRDQVESRRALRVIEKLTASVWGNEDFRLDFQTEPIFTKTNGDRLQRGNWDVLPRSNALVLKGIWQQHPVLARKVELSIRYAFRGNRLILTFVSLKQDGQFTSPFQAGQKIVLTSQ